MPTVGESAAQTITVSGPGGQSDVIALQVDLSPTTALEALVAGPVALEVEESFPPEWVGKTAAETI